MDVIQNIQKQMETEVAEIKKIENGKDCFVKICWQNTGELSKTSK